MYISASTIDDLLRKLFPRLLSDKLLKGESRITATKGSTVEMRGVMLQLTNPRMRLSRTEEKGTLFSCLGEWLWYLAGSNDVEHIKYYIKKYHEFAENDGTVHGAYGPRIFGPRPGDQVEQIIDLLKRKSTSRQAVIQIFDCDDLQKKYKDVPCTCTMQFLLRGHRLHMVTHMRSNDAFKGLPHDIFAFTLIQELIARSLDVELGNYKHSVGSLHLYDEDRNRAERYLQEGWQSRIAMPSMPKGDPRPSIRKLLDIEVDIRQGKATGKEADSLDPYWADLVRILQIYKYSQSRDTLRKISLLSRAMDSDVYRVYIDQRRSTQTKKLLVHDTPEQLSLLPQTD